MIEGRASKLYNMAFESDVVSDDWRITVNIQLSEGKGKNT